MFWQEFSSVAQGITRSIVKVNDGLEDMIISAVQCQGPLSSQQQHSRMDILCLHYGETGCIIVSYPKHSKQN